MSEETYRQIEDAIERKLYVLGAGRCASFGLTPRQQMQEISRLRAQLERNEP